MKRILFSVLILLLGTNALAQETNSKPCSRQDLDAMIEKLDANSSRSGDTIDKAIDTAIVAHDCHKNNPAVHAAKETQTGMILRAQAAIADDLQDPEKVKLMECTGIKVYKDPQPAGHPSSRDECLRFLQTQGISAAAYAPLD